MCGCDGEERREKEGVDELEGGEKRRGPMEKKGRGGKRGKGEPADPIPSLPPADSYKRAKNSYHICKNDKVIVV